MTVATLDIVVSPALQQWRCDHTRTNGRVCNQLLMMLDREQPTTIQIKCPKCGAIHVLHVARFG
jgi:phage FluMu protein Com